MLTKYNIKDITIVTGYKSEAFEELFRESKNIRLVFNPFYEITNVLPSFWFGQEYLKEDCIYMHADTLCDTSIFEELLAAKGEIVLPVDFKECDEEAMKVCIENNEVVEINKTMRLSDADGEFIGIAKISAQSIPGLKKVTTQLMKEKKFMSFFEVALQRMIDEKLCKITTIPVKDKFWCEIDFFEDYNRAKSSFPSSLLTL